MTTHVHRSHRSGWMRAGVLGANDGILSISGLMLGIAAAHASHSSLVVAGIAGLVAGSLSMAAGEYVSVSSQADMERADLDIERKAIENDFDAEHAELRDIYIKRGLDEETAAKVAQQLMAHDALGAHARDDIGLSETLSAKPFEAALSSSISFALGGSVPLLAGYLAPEGRTALSIAALSFVALAMLGGIAASAGGAPVVRGALRVLVWGMVTMSIAGAIGAMFNAAA